MRHPTRPPPHLPIWVYHGLVLIHQGYGTNLQCTWTIHGGMRVYARTCCNNDTSLCRDVAEQGRGILVLFNGVCSMICLFLIPVVFRERRRHHEARGWALMEIFLLGAAMLYSIVSFYFLKRPSCGE